MKGLLLSLLLLAQDFRSQLRPTGSVSISVEISGAKSGFEMLTRTAGLNLLFDPDFVDSPVTPPLRLENATVLDALDMLSMRTHVFFEVLDGRSIVVAPDDRAKHSRYDTQILKPFYVANAPADLATIVTLLRIRLQTDYISRSIAANAIILRENRARVAQAEPLITGVAPLKSGAAVPLAALNVLGHVLISDSNGTRTIVPSRAELHLSAAPSLTFRMTDTSQTIFENVARAAGLTCIFDRDFRGADAVSFNVQDVDPVEALDLLSLQTRNFWEVLDDKTILVAPDSAAKRQAFESMTVKTFTLSGGPSTAVRLGEIVTALRTLLRVRYISGSASSNTILIRATPPEMVMAERIIDDLKDPDGKLSASVEIPTGAEAKVILRRRAAHEFSAVDAELQSRGKPPISFQTKTTVRASYEELAKAIGIQVVFDKTFQDRSTTPMRLQNVGPADALDFLSLHTGNIWGMVNAGLIIVEPDNDTGQRDFERKTSTVISLKNLTQPRIAELVSALKTLFNFRQVEAAANGVQINDTEENVALAEKIVPELAKPLGQ
jgi:hypothetical protein